MTRWSLAKVVSVLGALALWLGRARADVPPSPDRPEWDETPLPMPSELGAWVAVVIALALVAAIAWWRHARAR